MKRLLMIVVGLLFISSVSQGQEQRREKRVSRQKAQTEMIRGLFESGELRFVAQMAQPLSGGTIHLTSLYYLDFRGDSAEAHLPFYGVAYSVEYGGRNGGIMFERQKGEVKWETSKHGYEVMAEVRVPRDLYQFHLSFTQAGYATLQVTSQNRQGISFTGIITRRESY